MRRRPTGGVIATLATSAIAALVVILFVPSPRTLTCCAAFSCNSISNNNHISSSKAVAANSNDNNLYRHRPACVQRHHGQRTSRGGGGGRGSSNCNDNSLLLQASNNAAPQEGTGSGTATIPDEIFNLVKSIIGAGVLALPAGIAASFSGTTTPSNAIIVAASCFLITSMGLISAYTFSMIAYVCRLTNTSSYAQAWSKTIGKKTAWMVSLSSALNCLAINLAYSMVLGDVVKDVLLAIGMVTTRSQALLSLTTVVLLPLCLVKNLSTLAPFSLVGILGMLYTSIAIAIRYLDGAYRVSSSGKFVADLAPHLRPTFGTTVAAAATSSGSSGSIMISALFNNPKCLILISMLSTAYIAHFNAPKFHRELKNNTPQRFNIVVAASFGIAIAVYAAVSSMAFLTFGTASDGLILNNYSTRDVLFSCSRLAVALSLIFSYPLIFVGLRDGILDLLQMPDDSKRTNNNNNNSRLLNQWTVGLVAMITALALKVTDLTLVTSMSGAVLGTSLIFVFPTLMFRAAVRNDPTKKWERRLCLLIAAIGVAVGGVGAKMALVGRSF